MNTPHLHPDTTEEVLSRADILDVISDYVVLKKRGREHVGLCPFHDEKSPSFSVNPEKQLFHCFGCGAGGNAITFLKDINKQSFGEVVLDLAKRYQIPVKTLEPEQREQLQKALSLKEQLLEIMAVAVNFYEYALRSEQGTQAWAYLRETRGLDEATIQKFHLGYAPDGWEALYDHLVIHKRYGSELVAQAGLIRERSQHRGYFDMFRNRVMIPIYNEQGKAIAFGSRTLGDDLPKYINSSDTPLFNKSQTLFALDQAKKTIGQRDQAIIVEGYFDAIALHRHGFTQTVATLGTACTEQHLTRLLRYTPSKQIILNFDADGAGQKATNRVIAAIEPLVYGGQVQLRVLNLPGGKDADEFLHSDRLGGERYQQALGEAPLWLDWQLDQALGDRNLKEAPEFQAASKEILQLLSKINQPQLRSHYTAIAAEKLSRGNLEHQKRLEENFFYQLRALYRAKQQGQEGKINVGSLPVSGKSTQLEKAEALVLLIYLHFPEHRPDIKQRLDDKELFFSGAALRFLWEQLTVIETLVAESDRWGQNQLLTVVQEEMLNFPEEMAQVQHLFFPSENGQLELHNPYYQAISALIVMEQAIYQQHKRYCQLQMEKYTADQDFQRHLYYANEYAIAQNKIRELNSMRESRNLESQPLPSMEGE